MTRQHWLLALALGLGTVWIAGCVSCPTQPDSPPIAERRVAAPPASIPPSTPAMPAAVTEVQALPEVPHPAPPAATEQPVVLAQATPPLPAPPPPQRLPEQPGSLPTVPPAQPAQPVDDPPVVTALHYLLENREDDAVVQLMRYDKPTQELLLRLLPPLASLSEGGLDKAKPADLVNFMDQLESALTALRQRAPLLLDHLCFCRGEIPRFASQQPLSADHQFRPGELVEVYAEVRNFPTEHHGPYYEIHLAGRLEIRDGAGALRWFKDCPDRVSLDRSKSPRHDHFLCYRFCIPEYLREGPYTLRMLVSDTNLKKPRTAESTIDFRVARQPIAGR